MFLTLKCANKLKTSFGETIDKNFWSFLTKSPTFLRFLTLKHKNEIKIVTKKINVLLLTLKCANGLKKSYGEIFNKLLVFFDQNHHFLEIVDTKTQKRD